jgi:hypothetical protein
MSNLFKTVRDDLSYFFKNFWQVEKLYGFENKMLATLGDALRIGDVRLRKASNLKYTYPQEKNMD